MSAVAVAVLVGSLVLAPLVLLAMCVVCATLLSSRISRWEEQAPTGAWLHDADVEHE